MAAIPAAAGLHLFIFDQVQQTGQWRRALLARLGGQAASAGTCQDAAATAARASARIIRTNHSHKISAYPIRTSIRTRTRARMCIHRNRMHWALPATAVVTPAVKWDKA
jgi:hypothetical protein